MNKCITGDCTKSKITGSKYCLKHWIHHRYIPLICLAWISGILINSPFYSLGLLGTYVTTIFLIIVSISIEDLEKNIMEYAHSTDRESTSGEQK